jgi:HEAT repeat protein
MAGCDARRWHQHRQQGGCTQHDRREAREVFARSLRDGLGAKPEVPLRALLGFPDDADDRRVARAIVGELAGAEVERLSRAERRRSSAAGVSTSLLPVAGVDRSFLGSLKVASDVEGEQSVAAMVDVPTLLAVLRAGSLMQRRAAARRIAERLGDKDLSVDDRRRIQDVLEQVRDVEIAYELLACHAVLSGPASREAQRARREAIELAISLAREVVRYWEGDAQEEPLMKLSGDARAQLMLHARDLDDMLLQHVGALIEGSTGAPDALVQRAMLSSVRYAGDPRLVPSLVALLEVNDSRLVIETARAISRVEDARVWPALAAAYERSVIDVERIALGAALGRLGDVRAADYVRAQLKSEDEHVLTRALEGLRTLGTPEDVPVVLTFVRSSDPVIASKAAHTLGRISDGRGLNELGRVGRDAKVSSLRAAVEEAVAQIVARLVLRGEDPTGEGAILQDERVSVEVAQPAFGIRLRALRMYVVGRMWHLLGARDRALRRFEDAVKSRPDWAMPVIDAALMYAARDEYAQALSLFRRALELARTRVERNPLIILHVARCFLRRAEQLERDGRVAIARGLMHEVLTLDLRRVPSSLRFEIGRRHETLRLLGAG